MFYDQKISKWMPEFVQSVKKSTKQLLKEAEKLNKLAAKLEAKNREKQTSQK